MKNIKHTLIIISLILFSNTLYSQGFIWNDEVEAHHKTYDRVSLSRSAILPTSVYLEKYLPYTHNQGEVGMCAAYAVATCRNIVYARNNNLTDKDKISAESYSPYYIYQKTKKALGDGDDDWAGGMPVYLRFINNFGFAKIRDVEYPYYYPFTSKCLWNYSVPTHSKLDLNVVKADSFDYIHSILPSDNVEDTTSDLIKQMKSELAAGRPMIFGMWPMPYSLSRDGWKSDYWDDPMYTCPTCDTLTNEPSGYCSYSCWPDDYSSGGHAMALIGYDDDRMILGKYSSGAPNGDTTYVGCFQIVNSWGSNWGDNGKIWIEYEAFVKHAKQIQSLDKTDRYTIFDNKESSYVTNDYYGTLSEGKELSTQLFDPYYRSLDWVFRVPIFGFEDVKMEYDNTIVEFSSEEIYLKGTLIDNEILHGTINDKVANQTYEGDLKDWMYHGQGVLTSLDDWGSMVKQQKGQFENNRFLRGEGIEIKDGNIYKGEFIGYYETVYKHGKGSLISYYGSKYVGEFWYDDKYGQGTMYYPGGAVQLEKNQIQYIGEWKYDKYDGQGTYYYRDGKISFEGEWKNGLEHGQGTAYYNDGGIYFEGEWEEGNPVRDNEEDVELNLNEDVKEKGSFSLMTLILLLLR